MPDCRDVWTHDQALQAILEREAELQATNQTREHT